MNATTPVCEWAVDAELGEGPIWQASEDAVYFVDIKGCSIHRFCAATKETQTWAAPAQPGFILPLADASFVCGLPNGLYGFDQQSGRFSFLKEVESRIAGNRLNDGFVDPTGRLWFGSMDDREQLPSGSLYRIADDGGIVVEDHGYVITNGPALSPDGRTLYHTDTLKRSVYAFDVDSLGTLSRKRLLVCISGPGYPDGMAVDSDGFVWVALFGGSRIERFSPTGRLEEQIGLPCTNVTKLAFGGDDLRTVYVTTAWKGLSSDERARQPLAGGLFSFRSATPGLPQALLTTGFPQSSDQVGR